MDRADPAREIEAWDTPKHDFKGVQGTGSTPPFAYMQDYAVHGWGNRPFDHLHAGSRGIDQFIGPPDMIGIGHGTAFIRPRLTALFAQDVAVVATDPRCICRDAGLRETVKWGHPCYTHAGRNIVRNQRRVKDDLIPAKDETFTTWFIGAVIEKQLKSGVSLFCRVSADWPRR